MCIKNNAARTGTFTDAMYMLCAVPVWSLFIKKRDMTWQYLVC